MSNDTADINIPNIEKELGRLNESSQNKKQHKACLFTLIIYANDARRVDYFQDLVDTILDKFPCRIIFIKGDNSSDRHYFHVEVSSVMSGGQSSIQGGSVITCDQIAIASSHDQLFRVPFVLLPHIVPDLPVYLLWGENPFEEHDIFPYLQPYASRVIFDSECSDDLKLFCDEMQTSLNKLKIDVMDINWALTSCWRDMIVQLFDDREKAKDLESIKFLTITYNDTKTKTLLHPEIRATYVQGWLASRLNWTFHQAERFESSLIISYHSSKNPVVVTLYPQTHSDLPSGSIISIEMVTTHARSYYIARKPILSQVVVHASSKETCELPFTLPLPNVHKGLAFMKEIFYRPLGDHYPDVLKMITKIDPKVYTKR